MLRRWLAWCALAIVVVLGTSWIVTLKMNHEPTVPIEPSGPVVLISVPELAWTDTLKQDHPEIYSMTRHGAVGGLLVRNIGGHSCSKNSWLTISSVTRTGVPPGVPATPPGAKPEPCPEVPSPLVEGSSGYVPSWQWRNSHVAKANPRTDLGLLGSTFDQSHECLMAAGDGAGLGAANRTGVIHHYVANPDDVDFNTCAVTMVSLRTPEAPKLPGLLKRIPDDATVVVAGLADDTRPEHLRAVVASGPDVPRGRLTSLNTRQPGAITTADLARLLILQVPGEDSPASEARLPLVLPSDDADWSLDSVRDLGKELAVEWSVTQTFFLRSLSIAGIVLAAGLGATLGYRRWARRNGLRVHRVVTVRASGRWIAGSISSIPVATFLIGLFPWWDAPHPGVALTAGVLALAVTLSAVAFFGPWRRWRPGPMCVILGITALTVAIDVVHGSRLQFTSMLGLQPIYAGRFYGIGNVGYAMMATAALVLAAVLAGLPRVAGHRWLAFATVLLVGVPIVIVDGYPEWGADGGGPLALLPALAYLAMNAVGLKVTWQRVAVVGGSTMALLAVVGYADYLRPARYRTHLGDAVADILQRGQFGRVGQIVKGNWEMLTSAWYMPIAPILLILAIALLMAPPSRRLRPAQRIWEDVPFLGHGLAAAAICWTLGFFANDSGTGIPVIGLFVLAPLVFALGIRMDSPAVRGRV